MAGKLILLTGGTGFLGRHLVPVLLAEGHRLRLLVRRSSEIDWLPTAGVEFVYGDITDAKTVERAASGVEYVVHAAGHFRFWGSNDVFNRVNVQGTEAVAKAVLQQRVARLIHISAIAIAGKQPAGVRIDENVLSYPQDPYQRSKLAAEQVLGELVSQESLPVVILRPGAYYGPFGRYGFNRLFIQDPRRGLRIQVAGGERMTFPVFVPDVARAVVLALTEAQTGEVYNICDQPVSHAEVNRIVSDLLEISPRRWNMPARLMIILAGLMEFGGKVSAREPFYPLNLRHYVFNDWLVSNAKARAELGFVPTPLREGLSQTIAWYKSFPTK
jgi:dihydroflavonol-4-reductase